MNISKKGITEIIFGNNCSDTKLLTIKAPCFQYSTHSEEFLVLNQDEITSDYCLFLFVFAIS